MSIVRTSHNKENPYVMLNKTALEEVDLSWDAKGLWAYLISRPDDWKVSVAHLAKTFCPGEKGHGEKAIYRILKELIDAGYCLYEQGRKEKGFFSKADYVVLEHKKLKEKVPNSRYGGADDAGADEGGTTNKGYIPNKKKKEEEEEGEGFSREEEKSDDQERDEERDREFLERIKNDPNLSWFPESERIEFLERFGGKILSKALQAIFTKHLNLQKEINDGKILSPVGLLDSECKKIRKHYTGVKK